MSILSGLQKSVEFRYRGHLYGIDYGGKYQNPETALFWVLQEDESDVSQVPTGVIR